MAAPDSGIFENEAAEVFVAELRKAVPTAVGDAISAALRAVAQAETPLTEPQVQRALAALALLFSGFDPDVLDGASGGADLRSWFGNLEIELNPARRQISGAAIDRILLPQDNAWYDSLEDDQDAAVANVHHLRNLLADSAADE
jgi:hypothetical protein